jgi:cysteine-rich repeat protein
MPDCTLAAYCGDGKQEAPEECDMGPELNNGAYGGCTPTCKLAAYCGDGALQGPEECDDGSNNGSLGDCTANCKLPS